LGSLEQLMGSQTVGATLLTQVKLRAMNPLSVGLILIWACSPLGGQSILRMLRTRYDKDVHPAHLAYFDTNAQFQPSIPDRGEMFNPEVMGAFLSYIKMLFSAALLSSGETKSSSMDVWRNVKIPFLNSGENDWYNLSGTADSNNADSAFYSALVGIPVNMSRRANATFSLESSYITLDCDDIQQTTVNSYTEEYFSWLKKWDSGVPKFRNGTWHGVDIPEDSDIDTWAIAVNNFVDPYWTNDTLMKERFTVDEASKLGDVQRRPSMFENETDIEVEPTKLFLHARPGIDYATGATLELKAYCDVAQKYVESRVTCDSSGEQLNCSVTAQRPSRRRHASESITYLSYPHVFNYISSEMPNATALQGGFPSLALQYLNNVGINAFNYLDDDQMFIKMNATLFSRRLSQILNTYILVSQMDNWAIGGSTEHQHVTIPVDYSSLLEVYSVSRLWMGFCLLTCFLLLIGGVLSVIFANLVSGPEVLGYASTVLRDSRFIEMPPNTGRMSAIDLTLKEKQTRV
jgi:hypothetical protein